MKQDITLHDIEEYNLYSFLHKHFLDCLVNNVLDVIFELMELKVEQIGQSRVGGIDNYGLRDKCHLEENSFWDQVGWETSAI